MRNTILGVVFAYGPRRPMAILRPGDRVCAAGCASAGAIIIIGGLSEVTWPRKGISPGSPLDRAGCQHLVPQSKTETALARNRRFESSSLQRRVGRTSPIRPAAPAIEIVFTGKARVAADTAASPKRVAPRSRASNGVRNHDGRSCNCAWQRRAQLCLPKRGDQRVLAALDRPPVLHAGLCPDPAKPRGGCRVVQRLHRPDQVLRRDAAGVDASAADRSVPDEGDPGAELGRGDRRREAGRSGPDDREVVRLPTAHCFTSPQRPP